MNNKVKYNLKNVHFAKMVGGDVAADGTATYGTVRAIPGAVSISLEAQGELQVFWADGRQYFVSNPNNGYEGDLEIALVTDEFKKEILNFLEDANGNLLEPADAVATHFALFFQFDGDVNEVLHCMYNCTCTRPSIEGQTKEDNLEPQTDTLSINCGTIYDPTSGKHFVKTNSTANTTAASRAAWFNSVPMPALPSVTLSKSETSIEVEATETLTATTFPVSDTVTFSSNNTSVATVNETTGVVTGVAVGQATITALSSSGATAQCVVTVVAAG